MRYDQPTMAEVLKGVGYSTQAVGKWHLGYANWKATPTRRGFDYHKGYFQGEIDYYNKSFAIPKKFLKFPHITGLDWWENEKVIRDEDGIYNKEIYDKAMLQVLQNYTESEENPLFLYYAHQLAHVPLDDPPAKWLVNCTHISNRLRRTYCAMMAALDDSLRLTVEALKEKGIWNDTFLVVTSDNGGMPNVPGGFPDSAGSNYPFRAGKGLCFEGGVRGVALVSGGVLPSNVHGTTNGDLTSAVDWFATSAKLANASLPQGIDSLDLWSSLTQSNRPVNRSYLTLNMNYGVQFPNKGTQVGIITQDNFKIVIQDVKGPVLNYDGWFDNDLNYEPPPANPNPGYFIFDLNNGWFLWFFFSFFFCN